MDPRDREGARARQPGGFTSIELLLGVALVSLAIAATSGMFVAGKGHMMMKGREIETTQAARSALDVMVRDLRLGGACLPVTGEFISLEGVNNGSQDEIIVRTGLTRPDLSCIRTASTAEVTPSEVLVPVESSEGFASGMRVYFRHPNGTGEYVNVGSVSSPTAITLAGTLTNTYPPTSGVYAIDQRRFFLTMVERKGEMVPQLMIQTGTEEPTSFAVGIEELNISYELRANCNPECDVVGLPVDNAEWQTVEQVLVDLTARSELAGPGGEYFRRSIQVGVKPRNILPR